MFLHNTSRDLDPQLHTHVVILNIAVDKEGRFRSMYNYDIVKNLKTFDQIYKAEFSKRLVEKGIPVQQTKDGFEIATVSNKCHRFFFKTPGSDCRRNEEKGINIS